MTDTTPPPHGAVVHYDQVSNMVAELPEAVARELLAIVLMSLNGVAILHQPGYMEKVLTMNHTILSNAIKEAVGEETANNFKKITDKLMELVGKVCEDVNTVDERDWPSVSVPSSMYESMMLTLVALTDETFIKRCVAANNGTLSARRHIHDLLRTQLISYLPKDVTPQQLKQFDTYVNRFVDTAIEYVAQSEQRVAPRPNQ